MENLPLRAVLAANGNYRMLRGDFIVGWVNKSPTGWRCQPNTFGRKTSSRGWPTAKQAVRSYWGPKAVKALDEATPEPVDG